MVISRNSRDRSEVEIIKLVNSVRETGCEKSFVELKQYVTQYIEVFGKKYRIPGCDADEIEQECLVALRYKAIEDFNPSRGKFKSFAILCIKRHLFSLIKGGNQHKRRVLNESLSLDEERSEDGDNLSLASLVSRNEPSVHEEAVRKESFNIRKSRLLSKLSRLEQEVCKLYLQQYHYDEIVDFLKDVFPNKKISKKLVDNALVRCRSKAQELIENDGLNDV